ncbi:CG18744, partial [Drosophila busckii]
MNHRCDLQLEKPSGIYYAGETVNGCIYLTLPERALIRAIALESNGFACSAWLQPQQKKKKQPKVPKPPLSYEQRVDYFAKVDYFLGSESSLPQLLDAGCYRYDFSVQLPANCPSSYEGANGHIRYTLKLLLHSSTDRPVEVVLNRQLQVQPRSEDSSAPDLGACEAQAVEPTPALKFWRKPLRLHLDIPRAGYEPGTGISVHVRLQNLQELPLSMLTYKLNQMTTYVARQKDKAKRSEFKVERRQLLSSSHQLQSVPHGELQNFQHLYTLQVPITPPTLSSTACACLQLSYEVEVIVQTKHKKRFIMAHIPIIISNAPHILQCVKQDGGIHSSHFDLAAMSPTQTPERLATTSALAATNLSASMSSLASSFREAEFMAITNLNKKDKHAMSGEQLDFRPRYLYYEIEHADTEKV